MKWSDGAPVHGRRFRVLVRGSLPRTRTSCRRRSPTCASTASRASVVKVDEVTVQFVFEDPYFLFYDMLAGDTLIGGGQSVRQAQGFTFGAYSPKHYLQAVPAEILLRADAANERAKKEGYENWVKLTPLQEGLVAQSRAADAGALEDDPSRQHADMGDGAQSLLLRRSTRRATSCPTSTAS